MTDLNALIARLDQIDSQNDPANAFALFEAVEASPDQLQKIADARRRVAMGELEARDIMNWRVFDDSASRRALRSFDAALKIAARGQPDAPPIEISNTLLRAQLTALARIEKFGGDFEAHLPVSLCITALKVRSERSQAASRPDKDHSDSELRGDQLKQGVAEPAAEPKE